MPTAQCLVPSHLNKLLTFYLNPDLRLEDVAESLNLTVLRLIEELKRPDVESAISAIAAAKARRAQHLASCAHDSAVAALVRLIESGKATGPVRAAAASLLRRIREATPGRVPRAVPPVAAGAPGSPSATPEHVPKEPRGRVEQTSTRSAPTADALPPPRGEGRGEGHRLRASSAPCTTDSDDVPAEKSVNPSPLGGEEGPTQSGQGRGESTTSVPHSEPTASAVAPRRNAASDCCQTPIERSSGAGLVSDLQDFIPRAEGASDPQAPTTNDRPFAGVPP